jgi:signal transduction histidine kinase/ligand-binding sensor domain-containing protein/DNA-binding response OmpR family regulator
MHYLKTFFLIFLCHAYLIAQKTAEVVSPGDFGDRYSLENLSVSDGLYANDINDVLQDSFGFLWLAGRSGLQKYDGYSFSHYKTDPINPAWQEAKRLFEDSAGNLWILMKEGLVRFQRESDTFVKYYFVDGRNDTISYTITAIAEDMKDTVWFWIYGKGLFKIDHSKNSFIPHVKFNEMYEYDLNNLVRCLVFDLENNLWIGMNSQGILMINPQKDIIKKYLANPDFPGSLSNNRVTASLHDQNGDLWFATDRGLNRFDPESNSFEKFYIDPSNRQNKVNAIHRIADDRLGNIWTVTNGMTVRGIASFNKKKKQFRHYSGTTGWPNSLTIDRSGIVWYGISYQGVYKLDPDANKFSAFSLKKNGTDLLKDRIIQAVCKDQNGDIWFGGDLDGLYRFNPQSEDYKFYRLNRSQEDSHNSNFILDIFQDSKGILWIGSKGGLIRFDPATGRFKHIHPSPTIYTGLGRTGTIIEGENGILWLATVNGYLVRFNPESEETEYYSIPDKTLSFRTSVADQRGFIWIGTYADGLIKFEIASKNFSQVEGIPNTSITSVVLEDSILWCSTVGNGLIRYNTHTKIKTIINETQGLLTNGLVGSEQDKSGNLWLSSPKGLIRYNPGGHTFKNYFKEDGFLTNEFSYRGHFKDKTGEMIFGSMHGIVTFHPDNIMESEFKPPLALTEIKIDNIPLKPGNNSPLKKHISISDEVILNHEQNDLSITFASLDFSHPKKNEYAFYLQNLEDTWRPPGKERTAYYTNLDPGEYIFKVKGTNSDGIWNEAGTSIKITVLPPWWKTTWAYIVYGLIIFATLYTLRLYELNRQKLKHNWQLKELEAEKYLEVDRMKSRFFANISHEFRTPLTLIKGPVQQMLSGDFTGNIKKQYQMILHNSNRLLQLINQLLDLSKLDSGQMTLRTRAENIIPLLKGLTHSFESLARQKNIDLQFQSWESEMEVYIDRDKFEKIIINLLSNAFKFTPEGGEIVVRVGMGEAFSGDNNKYTNNIGWNASPQQSAIQNPNSKFPDKNRLLPVDLSGPNHPRFGQNPNFPIPNYEVQISISNTGPSIPSEQLNKVFDRFYQADDSLQRRQEGSGIGLALTKELTELHHGKISVESNPGECTVFTIHLPLGNRHLRPEEIITETAEIFPDPDSDAITDELMFEDEKSDKSSVRDGDYSKLLIVEDNPDMRAYMHSCLEDNYAIIQAENGEKGFQQALKHSPDIVISDVMMPGMDGFQFCSKIKSDERTSHIPVILLTAKASGESKIEGLETGADDYLTKPFDKRELLVRIKNLIEQRQKLQEKFRREIIVQPGEITATSIDEQLLQRAVNAVEKNISNPDFDTTAFAREVGVSRMLLNTKIRALTGQTSGEFIRSLRLKRAAQLMQQNSGNVSEIAYEVGFQNLSYFAKTFREQFGQSPSKYVAD